MTDVPLFRTVIDFPDVGIEIEMYTFLVPPDVDLLVDIARAFYPGERWRAAGLEGRTSPRLADIRPEHVQRLMKRALR